MLGCSFGKVNSQSGLAGETWMYRFVILKLPFREKLSHTDYEFDCTAVLINPDLR